MRNESPQTFLAIGSVRLDLLKSNLSAFAKRLASLREAKESIELMYYIWREDTSGILLLDELLRAADRGVKVRIILDALNFPGEDSLFIGLNQHPNIEVKLYNPFYFGFVSPALKFIEFIVRAGPLNRRLHSKCWLIDRHFAVCGGRNIGDEYFGNRKTSNFTDMDVGLCGSVAKLFGRAFEQFWHSPQVKNIADIRGLSPRHTFAEFRMLLSMHRAQADATRFAEILKEQAHRPREENGFTVDESFVHVVWDPPEKLWAKRVRAHMTTVDEVYRMIASAKRDVCLVSPYLVPGPTGSKVLKKAAKTCRVKILTNSLAATDVIAAHSGVMKYRRSMLKAGVELYELKPTGRLRKHLGILPKSRASLHAKVIVIDTETSYIGSFNLDPRSTWLNCEMGVVIRSQDLAKDIIQLYADATHPANSWRLHIKNGRLTWRGTTDNGREEEFYQEPQAETSKRFAAWVFSWLPIEPLL